MKNKNIPLFKALRLGVLLLFIDFFCGFGGTSEGIRRSDVNAIVIGCVNHDGVAIDLHRRNHPETEHMVEDITDIDKVIEQLNKIINEWKKKYPKAKICLWFSAECTNLSNAKGGLSRDPDSRSLSDVIPIYEQELNPDYVFCENVQEFLKWGHTRLKEGNGSTENYSELAIDTKGEYIIMPDKKYDTISYRAWRDKIMFKGYKYGFKLLNVADFGLRTSRLRYWGIFAKCGLPIFFPKPTHDKKGRFGLKKWEAARPCLDLENKGESIFAKKRAPKSLERIFKGLQENVHKHEHFLTGYYGKGRHHSIDTAINTLTCKDRYALHYIQYDYSNSYTTGISEPVGSFTTNPKAKLMTIDWVMDYQFNRVSHSLDVPMFTLIASQHKKPTYLLQAEIGRPEDFIKDSDCEVIRKIKTFMIEHGIKDVFMRMLSVKEQLKLQSFGGDYITEGATDTQAKKFIGNSVPPEMARILIETIFYHLNSPKHTKEIYTYESRSIERRIEKLAA